MPEQWLIVASREAAPYAEPVWADAGRLAATGAEVTVVATDDAVLDVVAGTGPVREARAAGVRVMVDAYALSRRGLRRAVTEPEQADAVAIAGLLVRPELRTVWR